MNHLSRALAIIIVISCAHSARAESERALRPDPVAYVSPSRDFDALHVRLELDLDLREQTIAGNVTHRVRALKPGVESVRLNCVALEVEGVFVDGLAAGIEYPVPGESTTSWFQDGAAHNADDQLVIHLNQPADLDSTIEITVHYRGAPKQGLYFIAPEKGIPEKRYEVWSQGEGEDNRYWIPSFDYPNDKATFEGIFRVENGLYALSNGVLAGTREADGKTEYHWKLNTPQVNYLIMVAAGRYDVVEEKWRDVPLLYVVPPGTDRATVERGYGRTRDMMEFFSNYTGIDYPFRKYAQVVVQNFIYGGMENSTATVMNSRTLFDERAAMTHDEDGLVAHELAHQWWGDMVTCAEWSHLWLNEGFATYFQSLYHEASHGDTEFRYLMDGRHKDVISHDATDPRPVVVDFFNRKDSRNNANVYTKGASVLHMLRFIIGDELFQRVFLTFGERFKYQTAQTADFIQVVKEVSGENLDWFFEQWIYLTGHPKLEVRKTWHEGTAMLELEIRQTQKVEGLTPLFSLPMDVEITAGGKTVLKRIIVENEIETFHFPLSGRPEMVIVDKGDWILKEMEFPKTVTELLYQLDHGDAMARVWAARGLAEKPVSDDVVGALARVLGNDQEFWGLRSEAARALGQLDSRAARDALLDMIQAEPGRVRVAVVSALRHHEPDPLTDRALLNALRKDSAYEVRAEAVTSLVKSESNAAKKACLEALEITSYEGVVRRAGLDGLAELGATETLARVARLAGPGNRRTYRHSAISAYAKLAKRLESEGEREEAARFLEKMLDDWYLNTRVAVANALATLGETRSVQALHDIARNDPTTRVRSAASRAAESIERPREPEEKARKLETEIEALTRQVESLQSEIERLKATIDSKDQNED